MNTHQNQASSRNCHRGFTLWFTGLSGAGKSTVSRLVADRLRRLGRSVEVLDGDEIREHLSKGLGFSKEDREINIRRIGYLCKILSRNGIVAISAAISPYRAVRDDLRSEIDDFVEVYVRCPLDTVVRRDVKGLYEKALRGEIAEFTGVSDPYEEPLCPEIIIETDRETPEQSAQTIMMRLLELGYIQ